MGRAPLRTRGGFQPVEPACPEPRMAPGHPWRPGPSDPGRSLGSGRSGRSGPDRAARDAASVSVPAAIIGLWGSLPDVPAMLKRSIRPALGTDSLASADSLSIFHEMSFLWEGFPSIRPEDILAMGTINGARALGMSAHFGTLDPGKIAAVLFVPADGPSAAGVVAAVVGGRLQRRFGGLDMKVRLGKISFANCRPVYYGLNNGLRPPWLDLSSAPPTALNGMLSNSELDISPVSSVAYAKHAEDWLIIPSISIASRGDVMSVILVSTLPLRSLDGEKVITTTDSETSVELLRLCLEREGAKPVFEPGIVERYGRSRSGSGCGPSHRRSGLAPEAE